MERFICPNCGVEIEQGARVCPHCGSDKNTGWSDEAYLNRLGVSHYNEEDYQETIRREFGKPQKKITLKNWIFSITVLILIVLFIFYFVC